MSKTASYYAFSLRLLHDCLIKFAQLQEWCLVTKRLGGEIVQNLKRYSAYSVDWRAVCCMHIDVHSVKATGSRQMF